MLAPYWSPACIIFPVVAIVTLGPSKAVDWTHPDKNTEIKTIDDLKNLPKEIFEGFEFLKKKNLNVNPNKKNYKKYMNKIIKGLKDKTINFL